MVFEFLTQDLKKHMDSSPSSELPLNVVKVPRGKGQGKATPRPLPATFLSMAFLGHAHRATSPSCCKG